MFNPRKIDAQGSRVPTAPSKFPPPKKSHPPTNGWEGTTLFFGFYRIIHVSAGDETTNTTPLRCAILGIVTSHPFGQSKALSFPYSFVLYGVQLLGCIGPGTPGITPLDPSLSHQMRQPWDPSSNTGTIAPGSVGPGATPLGPMRFPPSQRSIGLCGSPSRLIGRTTPPIELTRSTYLPEPNQLQFRQVLGLCHSFHSLLGNALVTQVSRVCECPRSLHGERVVKTHLSEDSRVRLAHPVMTPCPVLTPLSAASRASDMWLSILIPGSRCLLKPRAEAPVSIWICLRPVRPDPRAGDRKIPGLQTTSHWLMKTAARAFMVPGALRSIRAPRAPLRRKPHTEIRTVLLSRVGASKEVLLSFRIGKES
jgi:hypothetical protein